MIFLLRHDTEGGEVGEMAGFLAKAVEVHRRCDIPATFFCTGNVLDLREPEFRDFAAEVRGDDRFDLENHSYSHIGLCYEANRYSVDELRADYEKSFASHERVVGERPLGISICGTSGKDGLGLSGFDATDRSREEFEMVAALGVRMINTKLVGRDESREFCNYAALGHPEIMGFPSAHSDTSWLFKKDPEEGTKYVLDLVEKAAAAGEHLPLMLHDWCAWKCAGDKELSHVARICDAVRDAGFELRTHAACLADESLWK